MNPSPSFDRILAALEPQERAAFEHATYFVLESCIDTDDHLLLASIEDAEDAGDFRIHIGLPDRPAMRSMLILRDLAEAVTTLGVIKQGRPEADLWLSTMEILAPIKSNDLWLGVLNTRASYDPNDTDCAWAQMAADHAAGHRTCETYGGDGWHGEHAVYAEVARQIWKQ